MRAGRVIADMDMSRVRVRQNYVLFPNAESSKASHPKLSPYPNLLERIAVVTSGALSVLAQLKPSVLQAWEDHVQFDGPLDLGSIMAETGLVAEPFNGGTVVGAFTLRMQGKPEQKILKEALAEAGA